MAKLIDVSIIVECDRSDDATIISDRIERMGTGYILNELIQNGVEVIVKVRPTIILSE